jgi:hypothetical protein
MEVDEIYKQCSLSSKPLFDLGQRRLIRAAIANSEDKKVMALIDVILQGYDIQEVINAFLWDRYHLVGLLQSKLKGWE